ncbi:MAG: UDP-N-acetyl-alpha-D-muramoyl-L-alanyl-L-glutamate epimerase [Patescibacteria group bacterium]|nr:UDP-N-acetyl-alpha-D-muramoyl-L-alanyl-L-glutamate epimerase [Patescibacteria group bacterium]
MNYQAFIFKNYAFNPVNKILTLNYSFDDKLNFSETFRFDFPFAEYNKETLDKACESLFLLAGVSYYKAYLAPTIITEHHGLSRATAEFLEQTYQKGLGEFMYVNKLDPLKPINFPSDNTLDKVLDPGELSGMLVGIGGGKDSLLSAEYLAEQPKVATWSVNHRKQLEPLVKRIGLPHFWVERSWDKQLLSLNNTGAYNGHVPISAIFAATGVIVALLTGYKDVIVSNEQSANEPTLYVKDTPVNHQYSKSSDFEKRFQAYLGTNFGTDSVRYYSFLRPLSELRIAEEFSKAGFDKYSDVFSSCNKAFTHDATHLFWDGKCPKCAFVFLALTPFVSQEKLESLFSGKNLLKDPGLDKTYRQLLGIDGDKPLECVGEIKESRAAMRLAQHRYPELSKYEFELPDSYDYRALGTHDMPPEVYEILQQKLN